MNRNHNRWGHFRWFGESALLIALAACSPSAPPALAPTLAQQAAAPPASSGMLADLGFRPDSDGLSFQNYGRGYTDLTETEMRRIFTDKVCARLTGDTCLLTPPAQKAMAELNRSMGGGHCYGFSVLALRFAAHQTLASDFGANAPSLLALKGNEKLQREIAYSYAFQTFNPVQEGVIEGTPIQVLDFLINYLGARPPTETYTVGFFKRDYSGGHAVTPYAIKDLGGDKYAVLIYDNNHPKAERHILFDRKANTWSYNAATNPDEKEYLYEGDAKSKSLLLLPTSPGLNTQECAVCAATTQPKGSLGKAYNTVFLSGEAGNHAHLLIADEQGRRYGFLPNGTFVREIPDVNHRVVFGQALALDSPEPLYFLPVGVKFTLTIDGTSLQQTTRSGLVIIGPGYDFSVEEFQLGPGEVDTMVVEASGLQYAYHTDRPQAPDVHLGIENPGADYAFVLAGMKLTGGGTLAFGLDPTTGNLNVTLADTQALAEYNLRVDRIDEKGKQTLTHAGIKLAPHDTEYLNYGKWTGGANPIRIEIDRGLLPSIR